MNDTAERADAEQYRWLRDLADSKWRPFCIREGHSAAQVDTARNVCDCLTNWYRADLESGPRNLVEEVRAETPGHNLTEKKGSRMESGMIGKYVIVRCRDAGVHAGVLKAHEGREALLSESRRLWYWKPANGKKFLSGIASAGLDATSKVGTAIDVLLTETCEIILCTEVAEKSIREIRDDDR